MIPYKVCGEILNRYEQLGGATSWLLLPIEHQAGNPDGQGSRQRFVGGFIYSHPEVGTDAVANHTVDVWQRHGWESGWLGYPAHGEVPVEGSTGFDGEINGWVQQFQGGRIYRTPALEGFQVASINGVILDKWLELGGTESDLGFLIADEASTSDGQGRFSVFQNGSIYWHPEHGAHEITGAIAAVWQTEGSYSGIHGYPISDVYLDEEANIKQNFSKGSINLKDYFTSEDTVMVDWKEVAQDYIDFLETYLGISLPPGSSSLTESTPMMGATQNSYPAPTQNSLWHHNGKTWQVVSPILIPGNYIYNTNLEPASLHDFCSISQDMWGGDTRYFNYTNRVADFRGLCAQHDMCYERNSSYDVRIITCDPLLRMNLKTACRESYAQTLTRVNCWSTAEGMYQAVKKYQGLINGDIGAL